MHEATSAVVYSFHKGSNALSPKAIHNKQLGEHHREISQSR
jgi:hypothetical protein